MKRPKLKSLAELERECELWNRGCPIGTAVVYHPVIGEPEGIETRTRSEAWVLSGHTAVIMVEQRPGCVCLEALTFPANGTLFVTLTMDPRNEDV